MLALQNWTYLTINNLGFFYSLPLTANYGALRQQSGGGNLSGVLPEQFKPVFCPIFRCKQMDHDIKSIKNRPTAALHAFHTNDRLAGGIDRLLKFDSQCSQMGL